MQICSVLSVNKMESLTLDEIEKLLLIESLGEQEHTVILQTLCVIISDSSSPVQLTEKTLLRLLSIASSKATFRADAVDCLINYLSTEANAAQCTNLNCVPVIEAMTNKILSIFKEGSVFYVFYYLIVQSDGDFAIKCGQALSNLTVHKSTASIVSKNISKPMISEIIRRISESEKKEISTLLHSVQNLTQIPEFINLLLSSHALEQLFPLLKLLRSPDTYSALAGIIRNASFVTEEHQYLLENTPLITYLSESLKLEQSTPEIKIKILETYYQLCATKRSREYMRDKDVYTSLKDFYNTQNDDVIKEKCEDVIGILIREEEEMKVDNLKTIDIPEDVSAKFVSS